MKIKKFKDVGMHKCFMVVIDGKLIHSTLMKVQESTINGTGRLFNAISINKDDVVYYFIDDDVMVYPADVRFETTIDI